MCVSEVSRLEFGIEPIVEYGHFIGAIVLRDLNSEHDLRFFFFFKPFYCCCYHRSSR